MNDEEFFIFTDEAGSWSNRSKKYYVRSWIKIPKANYFFLEGKFKELFSNIGLTWNLLKSKPDIANFIFNKKNKIQIFFTFTTLEEFYIQKFRIRNTIMTEVQRALVTLRDRLKEYMKKKVPPKIENAINYVLFLHVYEKHHLHNMSERLLQKDRVHDLVIEKPQFNKKDYKTILNELGVNNYKIKEKEGLGMRVADSLASSFYDILLQDFKDKEGINFYKKYISPYLIEGNCGRGVNKIFLHYNNPKDKELIFKISDLFQ